MQGAVEDPEGAAALAVARSDQLNLASETTSIQRALPLFNPAGSKPGLMRAEAWEAAHQILLDQGLLDKAVDLEAAYTLEFLEKIYARNQ
jgi:ABC-type nitrate/sulfonate/bicarbonate transport system substrate-binding protein